MRACAVATILLLCAFVGVVYSSCHIRFVPAGNPNIDCLHDGVYIRNGTSEEMGDCMRCSCRFGELQCCGIGFRAGTGVVIPPPGCRIYRRPGSCTIEFVSRRNRHHRC